MGSSELPLPRVIISTVIRTAQQGERHGSLYLVDLEAGTHQHVFSWDRVSIDWSGRGGDRGLRGIAVANGHVFVAAADEVLVFDPTFRLVETYRSPYLGSCHEVFLYDDTLYLTSTRYDALLALDLKRGIFTQGWRLALAGNHRREIWLKRWLLHFGRPVQLASIRAEPFDPNAPNGPQPKQEQDFHLNNVHYDGERLYFAGSKTHALLYLEGDRVYMYAKIPRGVHNARPYRDGALLNDTAHRRTAYLTRGGRTLEHFAAVLYDERSLEWAYLPEHLARQKFTRGLAITADGLIVTGSSPATVAAYRHGQAEPIRYVTVTRDLREAVHGLEIWPF